jgi:hypothetical protein
VVQGLAFLFSVVGIRLKFSHLLGKYFYLLSHVPALSFNFLDEVLFSSLNIFNMAGINLCLISQTSGQGQFLLTAPFHLLLLCTDHTFLFIWIPYNLSFFFFSILGGSTLWHPQKYLQYIVLEFTPSTILLYPPLPSILE